jgi:hypothetical protein
LFETTTTVDRTGAIANAATVERSHAWIHIVANAIAILVSSASSAAFAEDVGLVAVAVAILGGLLEATAAVDGTRAIANAAGVDRTHARIDIIANAINVNISETRPAALT